jgi:putative MFS transporter
MFQELDRRTSLTGNQIKILAAAIIGDALEFFDYFLIGFVMAFLIGPWKLTFGQSATVLMSSGIGAILGAYAWGWLADRIGRRIVFIGTVLNFSIATGLLYFTPDNGWIYLTIMRFFVGTGVGGLYCVDLPLVQEFMPTSKRGWVGGLVTCVIPLGVGVGAVLGAFMGSDQWRLLFAIGLLPALVVLLVRIWVPESPRWLCRQGRYEEARKSLAWALQVDPASLPMPTAADAGPIIKTNWLDLFKYPRSLLVSWLGNAGSQTGVYGVTLWAPSLFVLLLKVTPQKASQMMILLTIFGFIGRISFSYFSELMGRRKAGGLLGFGAGVLIIVAGYNYNVMWGDWSAFWLILAVAFFFADGGFAIVGPYAAEIWPSHLRTSGMGSAYGFGGIGKILGPVGLALIVGSNNYLKPDVPLPEIPLAFVYLGCWFLMAGIVYYFFGIETKGKSIEEIDRELEAERPTTAAAPQVRQA